MAIFPRERYTGTLTTDLFADDETTYFDDADQFLTLQEEAVEALAEGRRKSAAWVEVLRLYSVPWWQYRDAEGEESAGIVINLHPSGSVETREGLARREIREAVVEATRQTPLAPRPAPKRPEFSAELLRYVACQKSAAIQAALLGNPRKGKEVAALVLLLGFRTSIGARLTLHQCHTTPIEERDQFAHKTIETLARELADRLGLDMRDQPDEHLGVARLVASCGASPLYEALSRLSDEELDRLQIVLPILCFGEERLTEFGSNESLVNRIASDINIQMRFWWTPNEAFLSGLLRDQVVAIVEECGAAAHLNGFRGWTKKQLVHDLAGYFAERSDTEQVNDTDTALAQQWLPGIFCFPASKIVTSVRDN
jgi:ParB family chromosome partitioning protein